MISWKIFWIYGFIVPRFARRLTLKKRVMGEAKLIPLHSFIKKDFTQMENPFYNCPRDIFTRCACTLRHFLLNSIRQILKMDLFQSSKAPRFNMRLTLKEGSKANLWFPLVDTCPYLTPHISVTYSELFNYVPV